MFRNILRPKESKVQPVRRVLIFPNRTLLFCIHCWRIFRIPNPTWSTEWNESYCRIFKIFLHISPEPWRKGFFCPLGNEQKPLRDPVTPTARKVRHVCAHCSFDSGYYVGSMFYADTWSQIDAGPQHGRMEYFLGSFRPQLCTITITNYNVTLWITMKYFKALVRSQSNESTSNAVINEIIINILT